MCFLFASIVIFFCLCKISKRVHYTEITFKVSTVDPTPSELTQYINLATKLQMQKEPFGNILNVKDVTMAIFNVIILIHLQPAQLIQVQLLQVDVS